MRRARNGNGRAHADRQLAQGTGRTVRSPFLVAPKTLCCRGWDAFDPYHLPLPRATGPYAVVRTTNLISSTAKYMQFGAFREHATKKWTNVCMIEDVDAANPVNQGGNTNRFVVPVPGGTLAGSSLSVVPAAVSVQIMNPEALQTTTGIIAGAVCQTQFDINGRTETYNDLSTEFISFFKPRLLSAAKLALRGVQANAYPLNMSSIADFTPLTPYTENPFTLNGASIYPEGWSPIVIVNSDGVALQLLVSIEWRVRFDIGNPAVASHTHHGVTPDNSWDASLRHAVSLGNGIMDIVEKVASVGQAVAPYVGKLPKMI